MVLGSKPGECEFFRAWPDLPRGPPSLLYNGCRTFLPEVKRLECGVDYPPYLTLRSEKEWRCIFTPPLSFMACSRMNFTFTFYSHENVERAPQYVRLSDESFWVTLSRTHLLLMIKDHCL